MYGVVASMVRRLTEEVPEWVPEGALVHLDFVNGLYYANGSTFAVTALLGGGFDEGDIQAGGMAVWFTNLNRPLAIGAFYSAIADNLASGFSIIFEMDDPASNIEGPLIIMSDLPVLNDADWIFESYVNFDPSNIFYADYDALDDVNVFSSFVLGGVNRYGLTFNRPLGGGLWRYAMTMNGETAQTEDVAYDAAPLYPVDGPASIRIGQTENDNLYDNALFRSITVYAAVDEAALATLTELP